MVINIENSVFLGIYYSEILILAKSIVKDCDEIFDKFALSDKQGFISVDYETQHKINSIVVTYGNIQKILKPENKRKHNETAVVHATRVARGKHLKYLLEESGVNNLLDLRVRNGIEHFDERIDKLVLKQRKEQIKNSLILYNMTFSDKTVIYSILSEKTKHLKPYFLKVYVVSEKTAGGFCQIY